MPDRPSVLRPVSARSGGRPASRNGSRPLSRAGRSSTSNTEAQSDALVPVERPRGHARRFMGVPAPPKLSVFAKLVDRTMDKLGERTKDDSYDDVQKIFSQIRKQYDDVHAEAERSEQELEDLRAEIRFTDLANEKVARLSDTLSYGDMTREEINQKVDEISASLREATCTKKVYQHMIARLKRESQIVQEKITIMEGHLARKVHEVEKRQDLSRRVHAQKVQGIVNLETMEDEIEAERAVCTSAIDDLEATLQQKWNEVRRRKDFERWRYEVAMEAATEAFQATAGRYQKIYAIEKLTGNCLQKVIFEQAEESQAVEDGFQKIREVTGLADVMDIVHKFLNREVEHEQLRATVRETEVRLHNLREADANRHSRAHSKGVTYEAFDAIDRPRTLHVEISEQELDLAKYQRELEECQHKLRSSVLLMETITQWSRRMSKSFSPFEELEEIECQQDVLPYFERLYDTIDRFLAQAQCEMPSAKLAKLTSQAATKEHSERSKLLNDKDFLRQNCRVPASLDQTGSAPPKSGDARHRSSNTHGDDEGDAGFSVDRTNMKREAQRRLDERLGVRSTALDHGRDGHRRRGDEHSRWDDHHEDADDRSTASGKKHPRSSTMHKST